jgi:hypothetical protein
MYDIMKGGESGRCDLPPAKRMLGCVDTKEFKLAFVSAAVEASRLV